MPEHPRTPRLTDRSWWRAHSLIIAGVALFAFAGLLAITDVNLYTPDSTRYLAWARSIVHLEGFRDTTTPEPHRYVVHAPLYPLLLAPAALIAPLDVAAAKISTLVLSLLTLFVFYFWLDTTYGRTRALLGSLLLLTNPLMFLFSTEVLSDVPFLLAVLLVLVLVQRFLAPPETDFRLKASLVLALTCTAIIREIGIVLVIAAGVGILWKKGPRQAALMIGIPVLVYLLWYIRNELIIAPAEAPPITNARLFLYHFHSAVDASILRELAARVWSNGEFYGRYLAGIIFFPQFTSLKFDVVAPDAPAIALASVLLSVLRYPLGILTILFVPLGMFSLRKTAVGMFGLMFLVLYLSVVLIYPISDVRFLLPLVGLAIFYGLGGGSYVHERFRGSGRVKSFSLAGLAVGLVLAILPNILWISEVVRNSVSYRNAPLAFYEEVRTHNRYPSNYTHPFRLAGEWLIRNAEQSDIVLTQWKDLALWGGGRKVLNVDQTISVEELDALVRDYGVRYLVVVWKKTGVPEFALQMEQSRRYRFTPLERFADAAIIHVEPGNSGSSAPPAGGELVEGMRSLLAGKYAVAKDAFLRSLRKDTLNPDALLMSGVASELMLDVQSAESLFNALSSLPQAGMYLEQARLHRSILQQIPQALNANSDSSDRARRMVQIAAQYWNLGFYREGRQWIGSALALDPHNYLGLIFGAHFALREGDRESARKFVDTLAGGEYDNPAVSAWQQICDEADSVAGVPDGPTRGRHYRALGVLFASQKLVEDAIGYYRKSLAEQDTSAEVRLAMADLLVARRRYAPALSAVEEALRYQPANPNAVEKKKYIVELMN